MKRKIFLILVFFLAGFVFVNAQQILRTTLGEINIRATWYDEPLYLGSDELQMFVNYENATVTCVLDLGTIITTNDSLTAILQSRAGYKAYLWAKLDIPYINTEKNGTERFNVEGKMELFYHQTRITGRGLLEHGYEGSNYAAVLNFSFLTYFSHLTLPPPIPGLADPLYIEIVQTILAEEK